MHKINLLEKYNKIIYNICLVITILGLLFIVSGTSYAILSGSTSSENEQIIKAGDVTIALTKYYDELNKAISIMSDEEGLLQEETYDFNLKNLGDVSAKYEIQLVNEVPSDYNETTVDNQYIKIGIEINGEEHGPFSLEEANDILDSGILNKNELISYTLRVWIDEKLNEEINSLQGTRIFLKIEAKAEQALYEREIPFAIDWIMSKVGTGGLEQINHTGDSTLQAPYDKDTVEYRYRGSKPNNYVVFNNELWRIIGVLPTDDGTGNIENKIKIIKNNSINNIYWNNCATSDSETCTQTGKNLNDWTGASLNDYLNGDYYNSFTREAQNMIEEAKYYLGGYDDTDSLVNSMWSRERKMSGSSYYYENNPNSTVSKIALMYVSDYGYAASDECDESVDSYDEDICKSNNWLYSGKYEWFLNPSSNNSYYVHNLYSDGRVSEYSHVYGESQAIRPVLTLTPEVVISDGSGTESDPYMLS